MGSQPGVNGEQNRGEPSPDPGSHVTYDTTVQTPKVLIVDGETRADLFEHWLADDFSVQAATSRQEALDAFDETAAVAIVRNEVDSEL